MICRKAAAVSCRKYIKRGCDDMSSKPITVRADDEIKIQDDDIDKMIIGKLEESLLAAADTHKKRYTHEEIFTPLRKKYGYDVKN